MRVFYVSDLHLRDSSGPEAGRFRAFLEQLPGPGDVLILGGDLFDLFVGNKPALRRKFSPVLEAILGCAKRGVAVHYLEGNHDFHIRDVFAGVENMRVHGDDFPLVLGGLRIWVSHGDLIDKSDRGYRALRAVTRSLPFRLFLSAVPGEMVEAIGSWSSRQSRKYNDAEKIADSRRERIRSLYLEFAREKIAAGFQCVLVGHSHIRDRVAIEKGEYVNLGISASSLPYAVLDTGQGGGFELKAFPAL